MAGLLSCCAFVPSILGIVLGAVSLEPIRAGQARGRGLAIAGITTGAIGVAAGVVAWIFIAMSPEVAPIPGREVSAGDRRTLETMGVVQLNEEIELLYAGGFLSVEESGAVITADRLVLYYGRDNIESAVLTDIRAIEFTPGPSWFDLGQFLVETDGGEVMFFEIAALEKGDQLFYRVLRQKVSELREAAGRPPVATEASADDADG